MSHLEWQTLGSSHKIEILGLSPCFIGSGDNYSQLDYIPERDRVYIINFENLLKSAPADIIDNLTADISANFYNNIWKGKVKDFLDKYHLDWHQYIKKDIKLAGDIKDNQIYQFIKTNKVIYLPGSSIKGAMRTAILYQILKANPEQRRNILKLLTNRFKDNPIQECIRSDGKNDLLRALQISDYYLQNKEDCIKIMESNIYHLRNRELTIPVFFEVLDKDAIVNGTIKINKELIDTDFLYSKFFILNKKNLINAINEFSQDIVTSELNIFQQLNDPNLKNIQEFYKNLQNQLNKLNKNECILRIGQGSSILGITLYLLFRDNLDLMKQYAKLDIFHFNTPDNRNRLYGVARQADYLILPDQKDDKKPKLGEKWLCKIVKENWRNKTKAVKLIEKRDKFINIDKIIYPITRKFTASQESLISPFGWSKLIWQ